MSGNTPKRNESNTTLTISLSKELRGRIETAAEADRRKVSPWVAIQLEKVLDDLDDLEAKEARPALKVADDVQPYPRGNGKTG